MSECRDIIVQEQLPEYLHGMLPADDRALVDAHIAMCSDCRAELEFLRAARQVMSPNVPSMRIDAIVAALPRPQSVRLGAPRRRSVAQSWRIAAALTVIVLGGVSLTTLRAYVNGGSVTPESLSSDSSGYVVAMVDSPLGIAEPVEVGGSSLSDLADEDLEMLIGSMESLEAIPLAEPDVSARRFGVAEGGN